MVKNMPTRWETQVPGSGRSPGEGNGEQPTPVFLPAESHGQRTLAGCNPWDHKELDMTQRLSLRSTDRK